MRIGFHLVRFDFPETPASTAATLAAVGRTADEVGLDNLSLMDHYFQIRPLGPPTDPMIEGYTGLGFLAAHTETVELQLLVSGVTYRHPGLLAKIVATLDVLSGGRAVLGLGAAWNELEHNALGVPFPPLRERFERLEETLQIVRQMWSDDNGQFEGRHYQLGATVCSPRSVRRIPIMLGGSGEQMTLRYVAQYADACNLFANKQVGAVGIESTLAVLRQHCDTFGRPYDEIRRTILWGGEPDVEQLAEDLKPFADVGVQEVHGMHFGNQPLEFLRRLEPVIPAVHAL